LSALDYNSRSHVNSILNKIDAKSKETMKAMNIMTNHKHYAPKVNLETNEKIIDSLSKINELGLVNIQTNEKINCSLIKNNDLGIINNNKVSNLLNKITELETNVNHTIQDTEKVFNNNLKDVEENINNNIDQMTAIIQQDIIVENQVKSQKEFEKINKLMQEQNSVIIQQMQQLFQIFSSESNMMKNDIRDVKVFLTNLNDKTEHQHPPTPQRNNAGNRGVPPPPPPDDPSPNSSEDNTSNNPSSPLKTDNRDISKLLPPVKDWPKFSGAGGYDHITFINYIDHLVTSFQTTDEIVLVRLPKIFEGVALDWFITKQAAIGLQDWTTWKKLIHCQP
jgi:hypothetical protein